MLAAIAWAAWTGMGGAGFIPSNHSRAGWVYL
jgi:hypothetical protein